MGVQIHVLLCMDMCANMRLEHWYHFSESVCLSFVDRVFHWPGTLQVSLVSTFPVLGLQVDTIIPQNISKEGFFRSSSFYGAGKVLYRLSHLPSSLSSFWIDFLFLHLTVPSCLYNLPMCLSTSVSSLNLCLSMSHCSDFSSVGHITL